MKPPGLLVFVPVLIVTALVLAGIVTFFYNIGFNWTIFERRKVISLCRRGKLKEKSTLRETITGIDAVKVFHSESSQRTGAIIRIRHYRIFKST